MHITQIEQAAEQTRALKVLEDRKQRLFAMIGLTAYFDGFTCVEYRQRDYDPLQFRVAMAAREAMIAVYDAEIAAAKETLKSLGVEL